MAGPDRGAAEPRKFPLVGLGASAGGLAAFEAFFAALSAEALSSASFILVQHLDPVHPSLLPELLRRQTSLPVVPIEDGIVIQPRTVYVLTEGHDLEVRQGRLYWLDPQGGAGVHLPIDGFFRSLAAERGAQAVVISFVDITEIVTKREALRKANDLLRLAVVVRDSHDAITVQDLEGRILAWNPGASRLYGWSEAEALEMNVHQRIPSDLLDGAADEVKRLSLAPVMEPVVTRRLAKDGRVLTVSLVSTALIDENGVFYAIATTERAGGSL